MTYQITDQADIQAISDAYNAAQAHTGTWGQAYSAVLSAISDVVSDGQGGVSLVPKTGVDPAVWTWVNGAIGVNSNSGGFAGYIRQYTAEQYQLRSGSARSSDDIQGASNDIAATLYPTFLAMRALCPSSRTSQR